MLSKIEETIPVYYLSVNSDFFFKFKVVPPALKDQAPPIFYILRIFIDILCQDKLFSFIKTFGGIDRSTTPHIAHSYF